MPPVTLSNTNYTGARVAIRATVPIPKGRVAAEAPAAPAAPSPAAVDEPERAEPEADPDHGNGEEENGEEENAEEEAQSHRPHHQSHPKSRKVKRTKK